MDSTEETKKHIEKVSAILKEIIDILYSSGVNHDFSKLEEPEKSIFDEYTPKLAASTYGSDEYKDFLKGMKPALDNHYSKNRHHPEHFENGLDGMTLIDLIEMLSDWKAATERHNDGNIYSSLEHNKKRFGMSEQLYKILYNTAKHLKW